MNRPLHPTPGICALLLAIVACALPAQAGQPAPTLDPLAVESAVAGTAQAAQQQTQQAGPAPATATVIPTDTPTAPEVISSFGTSLVKLADGSTQFKDYRAGVQILFPPNWLLVRPGEPEYYRALGKEGAQSQWMLEEITGLQGLDLNEFRVNAYDMHPEHFFHQSLPRIYIVFQQDDTRTLQKIEADEKRVIKTSVYEDHEFLASHFQKNSAGMEIMVFEDQLRARTSDGTTYVDYNKGIFFKVPTGLVVIDLYIPSEQKEILLLEYDQVIASIELFSPTK